MNHRHSVTVEVLGYGGGEGDKEEESKEEQKSAML
jgi:hypothetical protein